MRELASREYTPALAYAATVLFLLEFFLAVLDQTAAAAGVHVLFALVLTLLVLRVEAPPWARLAGYGWAGLALLGAFLVVIAATIEGSVEAGNAIAALGMLPGAAWVAGASLSDPGPARALGIAASIGMVFSVLLALAGSLILVEGGLIVRAVSQGTLIILIVWFTVLGHDLQQGKRHWQSRASFG